MSVFKKILHFVVYTNIWVALCVAALVAATFVILGDINCSLIFFSFFATLLMYAYSRWFQSPARQDLKKSSLTTWKEGHNLLYFFGGLTGAIGVLFFVFQLKLETILWLGICGAISALYPLQFLKHGKLALRNVAGVKLFVISSVWAIVTTVLPTTELGIPLNSELIVLTLQRFLFVMAITIPFDIRDIRVDSPELHTLPYKLGVKTARQVALLAINLAQICALILYFGYDTAFGAMVGQLLGLTIAYFFVLRSTPKKPDLYFSFGVEGTSIILFFAIYIFTYFWP